MREICEKKNKQNFEQETYGFLCNTENSERNNFCSRSNMENYVLIVLEILAKPIWDSSLISPKLSGFLNYSKSKSLTFDDY